MLVASFHVSNGRRLQFVTLFQTRSRQYSSKHSKSFPLLDCISVGVHRFIEATELRARSKRGRKVNSPVSPRRWSFTQLLRKANWKRQTTLPAPCMTCTSMSRCEEFRPRTIWSISNSFTSTFKELEPIPQFKATAKLGEFLEARFSQSFWLAGRYWAGRPNLFGGVSGGFFLDGAAATDSLTLLLMKPVCIFLCLLSIVGWRMSAPAQASTLKSDALARSTQMIVVTTSDWNAVEGRLRRYERVSVHEKWRPVDDPISIVVGKNGLGWGIGVIATDDAQVRLAADPVKREGDGRAPAGVFALGTAFGYASAPLRGLKLPYLNLTPSIECVDDPGSKHYNRLVDRSVVAPDWNSSEHMRNAGESYRWGAVVDHNGTVTGDTNPPEPGGGSCVFLHIWHRHDQGTAGCTAMPQPELETLLTWLDPARKPLLVQLPEPRYKRLTNRWMLPKLINVSQH